MDIVTLIGLVAAFCTTASALPQAIKVIKTRQTRDLSLAMYILLTTGVILWIIYGFIISDLPIIIANIVTMVLVTITLIMKIRYK